MIRRSYRRVYSLGESFVLDLRDFNFQVAISGLMLNLPKRLPQRRRIERMWIQRRHRAVSSYLEAMYAGTINEYRDVRDSGEYDAESRIWVLWWQGEEEAPTLVKRCIESIREHAGTRQVVIITKENFSDYIDLPVAIKDKLASRNITITHLSEIIRFNLLANHGGLWLDATVFCVSEVPHEVFSRPLFSCRRNTMGSTPYISRHRWTSFAFGSWKGHPLFQLTNKFENVYWQSKNRLIDYLLVDYNIELACRSIERVRMDIDAIEASNPNIEELVNWLNRPYDASTWSELRRDTWMFKLTWRLPFREQAEDGTLTFYGRLLRGELV